MVRVVVNGFGIHVPPYSEEEAAIIEGLNGHVVGMFIGSRPPAHETPQSTEPLPPAEKPKAPGPEA